MLFEYSDCGGENAYGLTDNPRENRQIEIGDVIEPQSETTKKAKDEIQDLPK